MKPRVFINIGGHWPLAIYSLEDVKLSGADGIIDCFPCFNFTLLLLKSG